MKMPKTESGSTSPSIVYTKPLGDMENVKWFHEPETTSSRVWDSARSVSVKCPAESIKIVRSMLPPSDSAPEV